MSRARAVETSPPGRFASESKKILVGLSGGVDSALSAALLVDAGHEVMGVYLRAGDEQIAAHLGGQCPWEEDIADARRVAAHLRIPFTVIDVRDAYRTCVIEEMEAEYAAGRTPNPDILCNREMKFGLLLDLARQEGFGAVATGHYACVRGKSETRNPKLETRSLKLKANLDNYSSTRKAEGRSGGEVLDSALLRSNNNFELHRGVDQKKDQSYFLWTLTQKQLAMIHFPIGHLTKDEVRAEAERRSLPVATKKDSQGICFLGPVELRTYLAERLATQPGDVLNRAGDIVGRHGGAQLYTVGQRHGLGVTGGSGTTFYLVDKHLEENVVIVDTAPPQATEVTVADANWINDPPEVGAQIQARIRHGQEPQACQIVSLHPARFTLQFDEPQTAVAPGQSVVLSKGSSILGGGTIV